MGEMFILAPANPDHQSMNDTITKTAFFSRSLFVALLIPFTFACTGLSIHTANFSQMSGTTATLLPPLCVFVAFVAMLFFLVQLPYLFVKRHWFVPVNAFLFGCGFLLWVQANVFNWNFGELDGGGVDWSAFRHLMVLECVAYLFIIGLVIIKRQQIYKYVIHLTCLLLVMQAVPLVEPARFAWKWERSGWKQYEITYDGFFDYSKEQNVLLIIPDAFSSPLFQRMIKRHPEMSEWFSDFHYFPKQKSQGATRVSIPQMLTACDPNGYKLNHDSIWNVEGALPKTLTEAGFQTRFYVFSPGPYYWDPQWVSNIRLKSSVQNGSQQTTWVDHWNSTGIGELIDLTIVRTVPTIFKPADIESFNFVQRVSLSSMVTETSYYSLNHADDLHFTHLLSQNPASANSEKPIFNVIHLGGAHAPYNFNERFERETMREIEGEERQAWATILVIKRVLDDMKAAGVYDNTHIIIAGDHGNRYPRFITCVGDLSQFHNPILLIKRQNERHEAMVHRYDYTNVQDITPTILDLSGLENLPGRFSVFDIPADIGAQRAMEYEAFWEQKRNEPGRSSKKHRVMPLVKMESLMGSNVGDVAKSDIALKRSELVNYYGQLCYYVGDNPDVWNKTYRNQQGILLMTPANEGSREHYRGTVQITMLGSEREAQHYWFCTGRIDVTSVADGEYEAAFLLPQRDGSYAKNVLGNITVSSGIAEVLP